jgi:sporulation protein YlmC with PRC-barrel domain
MINNISPLRLPVRTESGLPLGSVVDVSIDPDTQSVCQYHVKPNRLVPDVVWSPLLIHRDQVVSISSECIVVDDAVMRHKKAVAAPLAAN